MFTQYLVTTRHGDYYMVSTYAEAKRTAQHHMNGYLNGTGASNDPQVKIQRVQYEVIHAYECNPAKNSWHDTVKG